MRSSEQERIGSAGVSATCSLFERIGWAPVRNDAHDLGTDLLVAARDPRRFERGVVVGVQVKTGKKYFRKKRRTSSGERKGWWYSESGIEHFDDWVTHGLPHLIVLCKLKKHKRDVAYWAHVTSEDLEPTNKGCRIFVPRDQTIDDDHADALLKVAATHRTALGLEGTVLWTGEGAIAPGRKLRCALVAPRLLAPHPNAGHDEAIDAFAGLALAAQGRFRDLKQFSEQHSSVPDLEDPTPGCDWVWLLMAAIWHWASTGSTEPLRSVFESAPDPRGAAASGIMYACALRRLEQLEAALDVLDGLIDSNALSNSLKPVDYGWVLVQRSRIRAEIGDISGSRADASNALQDLSASADDVTASPLAAAAAWQLFMTARRSQPAAAVTEQDVAGAAQDPTDAQRGVAEVITASDTAVSWWRAQMTAAALYEAETATFKHWAEVASMRLFHTGDPESSELFAAELSADMTAEQSRWRDISALRARQRLMRAPEYDDPTAEIIEGLDSLRRSGDHRSLPWAVGYLHQVGPLEAVANAVRRVPLDGWTHTSACTNFEMLAHAGDLLDEQSASDLVAWSLDLADGYPADFTRRVRPDFNVRFYALRTVKGLLAAASLDARRATARFIVKQAPASQEVKLAISGAVRLLCFEQLPDEDREALWSFARQDQDLLGAEVLAWLAGNGNTQAHADLTARAIAGNRYALAAMGDVRGLDNTAAARLIDRLDSRTRGVIGAARNHTNTGEQFGAELARLNLCFPAEAHWDPVVELLLEPLVAADDKRNVCSLIVGLPETLPQQVRTSLVENIDRVAVAASGIPLRADIGGTRTALAIAVGALNDADADTAAVALACGTRREREDVAHLLGSQYCPNLQPILAALINDPHAPVRSRAAHAIGRLANTSPTKPTSHLARTIANSDGTLSVTWLLLGLSMRDAPLSDMGTEIAQQLLQHRSGRVRHQAARALR